MTHTAASPSILARESARNELRLIRQLARCFQAFEKMSAEQDRQFGVTGPQFDIIATLGNTAGMTCKELAERTLMTKGTLTGVLDRLMVKGLIDRIPSPVDGRSTVIALTAEGVRAFEAMYPVRIDSMRAALAPLGAAGQQAMCDHLAQLTACFEAQKVASEQGPEHPSVCTEVPATDKEPTAP